MAKPDTTLKAFEREVKRLSKLIKTAESKGIVFLTSPIPPKPKRVTTKSVERLRKITEPKLLAKGYTADQETGELSPYKPPKSSTKSVSIPTASTVTAKSKVTPKHTPEELKQIRSQSAKKAAQTRAKREAENPEYRKRMQEIRKRNLEKAREAQRKFREEHPEEAKRKASEAAKKGAQTRAKRKPVDIEKPPKTKKPKETKTPVTPPTPPSPTPPTPPTTPDIPEEPEPYPNATDLILNEVERIISTGHNKAVCALLMEVLTDEIGTYSRKEVAERCNTQSTFIIECAQAAANFDSESEEVAQNAYALADMLTAGDLPPSFAERLSFALDEDFPWRHKKRFSNR